MSAPPTIPFHLPSIGEDEINAVVRALRSGWLTTGSVGREFEAAFAAYVGARHAVAVSSGTAALHLSLLAAGIEPGHRVLTTPLTFAATVEAIEWCGAVPVLADVEPATGNLDPAATQRVLEASAEPVAAVLPVHYGGAAADVEALGRLAAAAGARLVEDAAHALPAWRVLSAANAPAVEPGADSGHLPDPPEGGGWRCVGSIGDFTAFSFYATKPITTAEGGMITFDDDGADSLLRSLRLHGLDADAWRRYQVPRGWQYDAPHAGFKYNLPDVLAALGTAQLARSDEMAQHRRWVAGAYRERLAACEPVSLPPEDVGSAWHLFPIRLADPDRRDGLLDALASAGIGTSVHFRPIHTLTRFRRRWGWKPGDFPVAEGLFARFVSLPIHHGVDEAAVERVASEIEGALAA